MGSLAELPFDWAYTWLTQVCEILRVKIDDRMDVRRPTSPSVR